MLHLFILFKYQTPFIVEQDLLLHSISFCVMRRHCLMLPQCRYNHWILQYQVLFHLRYF